MGADKLIEWRELEGGCETVSVKDIWAGKQECSNCGGLCDHYLYRKVLRLYFFIFTIGDDTKEYHIACNDCGYKQEINKEKYFGLKKRQMRKMYSGSFPRYVMERDYSPANLCLPRKTAAFILSLIFICIFVGVGLMIALRGKDAVEMIGFGVFWIILTVLPFVIFYRALRELFTAVRYLWLYRKAMSKS